MKKFPLLLGGIVALASLIVPGVSNAANDGTPDLSALQLSQPVPATRGPAGLSSKVGEYVVTLASPSLAKATKDQGKLSKDAQKALLQTIKGEQDNAAAKVKQVGGKELARVSKALNALVVAIDARQAAALEQMDGIARVRPLNRYELDLSETVPYIGAAYAQAHGNTGAGIRVAVLDSGIDYTHVAFGGPGTVAAYKAAYGNATGDVKSTTTDGLFPTAKVIGGYDFVGEAWPNGALTNDPDPIDCSPTALGCAGGHGTHVADIIAGMTPGKPGVAPGALLYAVKVCSSVATSCSGVALLQGVDFALDPNGDGDISDHVDVINLSLGSSYGQDEDDLTNALNNAVDAGVVVVASAGNSADRPYIVGSPSSGRNVISVAQTQVPSASLYPVVINSPAAIAGTYSNTATVDWAPIGAGATGDVAFIGRGCPAGTVAGQPGADPYPTASFAGKIALIDRGACSVSLKVDRAAQAGAIAVLIGLVASGDAISFSFGGGTTFVPTLVITQSTSNLIKANIAAPVNASISLANAIPLVGSMVGSSSRGPTMSRNTIKPDIGAPGASVSAEVGTGTGTLAFGGTSGAAPMVAGSAALLLGARPGLAPTEVKALLMNTGQTTIYTNPGTLPGVLAPITRIGGGEVRIDKAIASQTAAWDKDDEAGSLSFGYNPISKQTKVKRKVVVKNYGASERTYQITSAFRYADDATSGAVSFKMPASIKVPGGKTKEFDVEMTIDAASLPIWNLNGGSFGGTGALLQTVEFDGYLTLDGGANDTVHLAWQVLPHRAADVTADPKKVNLKNDGTGTLKVKNRSDVLDGRVDVFALTGMSPEIKKKLLPQPGDNFAVVDLKSVGVRVVGNNIQFAIDTFRSRAHPAYPAEFDVYVDSNNDGTPDFVVYNAENGTFASTGQTVINVVNLATGAGRAFFFADADLDSGNMIMTAPLAALGLTAGTTFNFSVYAFDNYFTGNLTDAIENMTYTGNTPRFALPFTAFTVPAGGSGDLGIATIAGGDVKSPSQSGFLLMYRDAEGSKKDPSKDEAQAIEVK